MALHYRDVQRPGTMSSPERQPGQPNIFSLFKGIRLGVGGTRKAEVKSHAEHSLITRHFARGDRDRNGDCWTPPFPSL